MLTKTMNKDICVVGTTQWHYHLIATINHTGNLNRGHYTSFIKIPNSTSLLHCNDPAVLRANENKVSNTSSYITSTNHIKFFFLIALCKGAWISFLVFRCDDPTYNPSSSVFYFVRALGYLSLSLGVMTLHITSVTLHCIVKMLLQWWWFAPTAWHAHNCEWRSSHKILNVSCRNPVVGVSTDDLQ